MTWIKKIPYYPAVVGVVLVIIYVSTIYLGLKTDKTVILVVAFGLLLIDHILVCYNNTKAKSQSDKQTVMEQKISSHILLSEEKLRTIISEELKHQVEIKECEKIANAVSKACSDNITNLKQQENTNAINKEKLEMLKSFVEHHELQNSEDPTTRSFVCCLNAIMGISKKETPITPNKERSSNG